MRPKIKNKLKPISNEWWEAEISCGSSRLSERFVRKLPFFLHLQLELNWQFWATKAFYVKYWISILSMCVCMLSCSVMSNSLWFHGLLPKHFQARILGWIATSYSRGSILTKGLNRHLLHLQVGSLPLSQLGSPILSITLTILSTTSIISPPSSLSLQNCYTSQNNFDEMCYFEVFH